MAPRRMAPRATMGATMGALVGAVLAAATMAHMAPPVAGIGTVNAAHMAPPVAPLCMSEDGSDVGQTFPCLWDAPVRGNGTGRSFYLGMAQGEPFYFGPVSAAR